MVDNKVMKLRALSLLLFLLHWSIVCSNNSRVCGNDSILDLSEIKKIEYFSYVGRDDIKHIIFSDSLKEIGQFAFHKCYNLDDVKLPDGCEIIQPSAFRGCVSMKTIQIPSSVSFIGVDAIPLDAVMIVEKRSEAKRYAKENDIRFVYKKKFPISNDEIGPILKTCWNQPIHYFYSKEKYGEESDEVGMCGGNSMGANTLSSWVKYIWFTKIFMLLRGVL